jgi:dienelactone hydrolase
LNNRLNIFEGNTIEIFAMNTRMKPSKCLVLLAFLYTLCFSRLFAQPSILWGNLQPGPYHVGFRVINRIDSSRQTGPEGKSRPLQISIWYPADSLTEKAPLKYKDYLLLTAYELNFGTISPEAENKTLEQYTRLLKSNSIPDKAIAEWYDVKMAAIPGSKPKAGPFPLVMVGQGNLQSAHHQAILSEYLASHGYVVATAPSPMRISKPLTDESDIFAYAQEQANDMTFAIRMLKKQSNVDSERLSLIGHSFGARAALLLLLDDLADAKALVSFDGGIANKIGKDWLVGHGIVLKPEQMTVPILHFYEDTEEFMVPDFTLLESLTSSDRYLIKIDQMRHLYFTSIGMVAGVIPGFAPANSDAKLIQQKYEAICLYTLRFLDIFNKLGEQGKLFDIGGQKEHPDFLHLTR